MIDVPSSTKSADLIRSQMEEIRRELPGEVNQAQDRARELVSWKYHYARNPWPILAAAAIGGYWIIPAKPKLQRLVLERDREPLEPPKRSLVGGIVGAVATIALKQATAFAAEQAGRILNGPGKGGN